MEDEIQRIRVQQYIDQVGEERYTIECLVTHMTDVELKRILLDLPQQASEVVHRVIDEASPEVLPGEAREEDE